ncbi:hypothetical protein [Paraburkholderia humisilvae]|uniref:hypothetical protein n=1 Tax=Paraburkholderia humisilvae TaxID=627669 RepID=UPI0015816CC0
MPSTWADPDSAQVHPRDAHASSGTPLPSTITTDSDSTLTSPQTLKAVNVTAASAQPAFDLDTSGVVEAIGRDPIDARNVVATDDVFKYAPEPSST